MNVFLTGCTGFLGGELLADLSKHKEVDKIFCLVRALSNEHAQLRIKEVFDFHNDYFDSKKIIPVVANLGDHNFFQTLSENKLLNETNIVIHAAANTSFSKIYDAVVEQVNISGFNDLLKWASALPHLNYFVYVGTASICGKEIRGRVVKEEESPNLKAHHVVKYTFTKMMGEIQLRKILPEEKILIVRPSIIIGDSREWLPRSYVILWAVATVNMMRLIPVNANSNLDMIPVDFASSAMVNLLFRKRNHSTYHISSGAASATNSFLLTNSVANFFPELPPVKFVHKTMIKPMKLWAKNPLGDLDGLLQHSDYLDYWKKTFSDGKQLRILLAALEPYLEFAELGQVFDNSRLLNDTGMNPPEAAHSYLTRTGEYVKHIDVFEGAVDP